MKAIDQHRASHLLLAVCLAIIALTSWLAPFDAPASAHADAGLKRALVSFASARALDALISVAQGTEVAVQPGGIGVVLSPGQVLDPVNDLVEQFADLMLAASVAFGVQKVLLAVGAHAYVSLALTLAAFAWPLWRARRGQAPGWLSRLLAVLLMARFALPLAIIGSDALFDHFMAADYRTSQQGIESVSGQLDAQLPPGAGAPAGWLERFKDWEAHPGNLKARYGEMRNAVEQSIERIVKLIVIFVLQTIVLPILLLWTLWSVLRRILEPPPAR